MRQEIELYLGGRSVEFNEPPEILFSYIRTDYTDPTVLRNSYSKTLTIEGTPNNNQIFNSIYHLDKISDYGTFNPAKRMDFQLFSNGDILEQGYAKLDKINKDGKNITYDITLYGGLGEFLYNLSYDQTAEGSDTSRGGGEDRRLSSLIFYDVDSPNTEFDFDITKDTVAEAWDALEKGTGATKWQYINFAPAYNGYPQEFDADKVLINTQNSTVPLEHNNNGERKTTNGFPTVLSQGDSTYRAYNNYAIGQMPKEMTEWEMRDLRSYLQRPVMSMKGFINAISNPVNNGGYEVDLDPNFFNANNPYYEKAWVTLPQLKKDETETGQSAKTQADDNVLSVSSYMGEDYDVRYYLQGIQPGSVYNGIELKFSFNVNIPGMGNEVMTTAMDYNAGGIFARDAGYFSSIFVQLVGEDENGNAIAASPIYNFTSPYGNQKGFKFLFGNEWEGEQTEYMTRKDFSNVYTPIMETTDINSLGAFKKGSGSNYTWYEKTGQKSVFTASLSDKLEYHRVYFRVTKCYRWRNYKNGEPDFNRFEERIFSGLTDTEEKRRNILMTWNGDDLKAGTAITQTQIVGSQVTYSVVSDVVRSGEHISKGDLLNFDGTPCDYLLSYCKLFNLYLSKDIYDKVIHIRTRDTFYNGGTIDLDRFIDRSKEIKVSPLAMESRWYDFAYPEDEQCGAAEDYDFNYGVEYGKNKVQTTYEFDSAAKNLFDGNIYQNGVQVQESSKYFTLRTAGGKTVPTFMYGSIDYQLFRTPNDSLSSCFILPPSGYTQGGYISNDSKEDWLPKLQLNNDNDPIDGTNVLCFYGGFKSSPTVGSQQVIYYLTDDLAEMYVINGETPCWLWTKTEKNGNTVIAKGMTKLPVFSRMLYNDAGDKIDYTWDFGRVRNTYVPVKAYTDKATIFERWWANYIADLYNANTRVVEAYVKMEGKVVGDWLRAMYWWDNCYWVLTEINDYNITSYATTRCKFVKVNDITNYTSAITPPQPATPTATLVPSTYMIPASGGTITATVKTSDGGSWHLEYPNYVHPSQVAGTGDTQITLQFDSNPNSDGREFDISAYRTIGTNTHFWQEGTDSTDQRFSMDQQYFIISSSTSALTGLSFQLSNKGDSVVTLQTNRDWITGGTITWNGEVATFSVNTTYNPNVGVDNAGRNGTVNIMVDGVQKGSFTIYQMPYSLYLDKNGQTKNLTWAPRTTASTASLTDASWFSLSRTSSYHQVSAGVNTTNSTKNGMIDITLLPQYAPTGKYNTVRFRLYQNGGGGSLSVSPTAITADYTGGDKVMTVSADTNWTVTSKPDWITLSQSAGTSGQTTLIVTFSQNDGDSARTGTITVSDGTRTATVNLTQNYHIEEYYFEVSPTALTWDYPGGAQYINVNSSERWTVSSFPAWVITSSISGNTGTSVLSVTARQNTSYTNDREGNLVLTNGTDTITIPLFQSRKSEDTKIKASPDSIYFELTGNTQYVNLNSPDAPWTVVSKPDWVVISQNSGQTGYTMLTITAPENTGTTAKNGEIVISDGTNTTTITLSQPSSSTTKTLTVNPSIVYVENSGGTPIIHIAYGNRGGDDVTISSTESWVTPTYVQWTGDSGNCVLNVANYGVNLARTATITITSILDPTLSCTMTVNQKALPYITLNPSFINYEQSGGTATITLNSNTDWIIDITDTTND